MNRLKEIFYLVKLFPYVGSYSKQMSLAVITGILHQLTAISCSAVGAYLVGVAATSREKDKVVTGIIVLVFLVIIRVAMRYGEMWYAHVAAYGILSNFRVTLYKAIERLAPSYLMNKRTGEMASTLMADVEVLEWFYAHTAGVFIVAVVVPLITLTSIAFIHWTLPIILIPWITLVATVPFWFRKRAEVEGKNIRNSLAEVNAEVVDGIQGVKEILSFGYESHYLCKLKKYNQLLSRKQLAYGKRLGLEGGLMNLFMSFGMLSVLACSIYLMLSHQIDPRLYPVSIILAIYIFNPIIEIAKMARNFGIIQAAAQRVFLVLEMPPLVEDKVNKAPDCPVEPKVSFQNVTFKYKENLSEVLKEVSFEVYPGETVALVGHSGAGKSTCSNLLMRFWDVQAGSIKIGSHKVDEFPQETLRSMIAVVPQDVYLFNTSVAENIRLGNPDADEEGVKEAAKLALAHDFIQELPQGYDTIVGERGTQLSGGQRQRIAIARALLKNAPILLMDEAVSSLDAENEQELQEAISSLQKGRTTLVIAHRLSTILSADRIVVLEQGKAVESGTHYELLKNNGVYSRLIGSQYNGVV